MQFGYYGKTIHRGDFVKFNLPQIFINVWDDWLQQVLQEGDNQHEGEWGDIYISSCAYRFGLSAGIAGETPWIGVMYPTTDKVGRRFPFCIALSLPEGISPIVHSTALEPIYAGIQELVKQVTQPDYDFDSLQNTMAEMSTSLRPDLLAFAETISHQFIPSDPSTNVSIRTNSINMLNNPTHVSSLLDSVLRQTWFSYSIWQPVDPKEETQSSLVSCGFPMIASALALYDGAWSSTKTGNLQLLNTQPETNAQAEAAQISAIAVNSVSTLENTAVTDSTGEHTAEGSELSPGDETTPDTKDIPFEFQKTEKIPPPIANDYDQSAVKESIEDNAITDDFEDPIVEPLELDDELPDDNPWDNK